MKTKVKAPSSKALYRRCNSRRISEQRRGEEIFTMRVSNLLDQEQPTLWYPHPWKGSTCEWCDPEHPDLMQKLNLTWKMTLKHPIPDLPSDLNCSLSLPCRVQMTSRHSQLWSAGTASNNSQWHMPWEGYRHKVGHCFISPNHPLYTNWCKDTEPQVVSL